METTANLEQTIIDALRAQIPLVGLPGVRLTEIKDTPTETFDASFEMESGRNRIQVFAEIKPYFTPKALEAMAPWIARLKAVQPEATFAVVTPYLSQQAQEFCIEQGIDFIDLAGNVSINAPGRCVLRRLGTKRTQPLDPR